MPDDFGRDTLSKLAFGFRIDRQNEVGMGLDVDKTRRDGEAVGINDLVRVPNQAGAQCCNAAREESNIADAARAPAAVDQVAVAFSLGGTARAAANSWDLLGSSSRPCCVVSGNQR